MAEKKDGYAPAMVMARAMFNVLEKSATNSFGGYDYSTLGDYLNAMEAALSANRL